MRRYYLMLVTLLGKFSIFDWITFFVIAIGIFIGGSLFMISESPNKNYKTGTATYETHEGTETSHNPHNKDSYITSPDSTGAAASDGTNELTSGYYNRDTTAWFQNENYTPLQGSDPDFGSPISVTDPSDNSIFKIADVQGEAGELLNGKLAYDIPDTMEVGGDGVTAIVAVTKSQNSIVLYKGLDSTRFNDTTIKLTSLVKVSLIDPMGGNNFKITPINTPQQTVDDSTNTIWKWNVIALNGGLNFLTLIATIADQNKNERDLEVFRTSIQVKSSYWLTISNFVRGNWEWFASTLLIPILIGLYNRFKKKKRGDENKRVEVEGFKIPRKNV